MAIVKGGDIRQFTAGGREMDPKADSDFEIDLPGFDNELTLGGNGRAHATQKRTPASLSGEIMHDPAKKDLEYVQGLANAGNPVSVTLTLVNGYTYGGTLLPVGAIKLGTKDGSFKTEWKGEKLEQI